MTRALAAALLVGATFAVSANVANAAFTVSATAAHAELVPVDGVRRTIDGDTFIVGGERIRLLAIDAPELRSARCPQERAIAIQATNRLRELLGSGPLLIERRGTDRYGRTLARVFAAGQHEVGEMLVAEGLAIEWKPGKAAKLERLRVWCGSSFVEGARS